MNHTEIKNLHSKKPFKVLRLFHEPTTVFILEPMFYFSNGKQCIVGPPEASFLITNERCAKFITFQLPFFFEIISTTEVFFQTPNVLVIQKNYWLFCLIL